MHHRKKVILSLFLLFCIGTFCSTTQKVKAAFDGDLGDLCDDTHGCKSGKCQQVKEGDAQYIGKSYCVCADGFGQANKMCSDMYGTIQGETWSCASDNDPNRLTYCKTNGGTEKHIDPSKAGLHASKTWAGVSDMLTDDEVRRLTSKPTLKIKIPGLKFTDPKANMEDGNSYLYFPLLGEYLKAVYRYGIAAAGIMAVVIIINAGFLWTRSGGNSEVISKQKESIEKAIVGLVIAVTSYVILYAINPNLTEFQSLKVLYVKGVEAKVGPSDETPSPFGPSNAAEGNNGVPYFSQWEGWWATRSPGDNGAPPWPYDKKPNDTCDDIHARGCGSTSFAMIMAYYGFQTNPFETGKWGLACHGVFPINATVGNKQKMSEKWPGINAEVVTKNLGREKLRTKIISSLQSKNPILFNCYPCEGKNREGTAAQSYPNGHFVVITGFHDESIANLTDSEIFVNINDPGRNKAAGRSIETMSLAKVLDTFLVGGFFKRN